MLKIHFASGLCSMQYKAEHLGRSGSLLLQTEAAVIGDYGRKQIGYRYVLYMTPQTRTIPLRIVGCSVLSDCSTQNSCPDNSIYL